MMKSRFVFLLLLLSLVLSLPGAENGAGSADPAEALRKLAGQETKAAKPIRYIFYSGVRYVLLFDVADFYGLTS